MPAEAQSSLIDELATFTTRLDALRTDQNPDDLSNALRAAFKERDLYDLYISSLAEDAERVRALLKVFDKALTAATHDVVILSHFMRLCSRTICLPASHVLPETSVRTTEDPATWGGFSDVWEGIYDEKRVAIKVLRVYKEGDIQRVRKAFCNEVAIWRRICHPNIVPFLGVWEAPIPFCMVSEWMQNGNVRDCVVKNPESNRLKLLLDISRGVSFLHSLEMVHGDLKGDNILVDNSGRARLNDFGFTTILNDTEAIRFRGSYRWMAPELFNTGGGKSGLSTYGSDIFALGMVSFEVFTGQVPFPEGNTWGAVMKKIIDGKRPSRPPKGKKLGLSDELWELVRRSLAHGVEERPAVSAFVDFLEKATWDIAVLRELTDFDANSEEDTQKLRLVFRNGDDTHSGMGENEILGVPEISNSSALPSRCLSVLQKVSARFDSLSRSYRVSPSGLGEPNSTSPAVARTSGARHRLVGGSLVAVKRITPNRIKNFNSFKHQLYTNAVMWKRLQHPNVVTFLGFGSGSPLSLVYPWMSNGSLLEYVRENRKVDKLGLLLDVARGLTYLHWYDLVHGNLTGHNILVGSDGVACISEYGLGAVLGDGVSSKFSAQRTDAFHPDNGKAADIYSFAMIMFRVLSGVVPFPEESDKRVSNKIAAGLRPNWPSNNPSQELVDALREPIDSCWNQEPDERPTSLEVLRALLALEIQRQGPIVSVEDPDEIGGGSISRMTPKKALGIYDKADMERLKLLNKLCKVRSRQRLLPRSMRISDHSWESIGDDRYGGNAAVSQCTYNGRQVAVKVPYVYLTSDFGGILSNFCREAVAWKHLQHPNVLPLLGVTLAGRRFAMVSEWMEDGNVNDFIQKDPDVNRIELLVGVAKGLAYMHSLHLVHGDLKGANILISKDRRAYISDFGLSTMAGVRTRAIAAASFFSLLSNDTAMSYISGGTMRWMSPELLYPEKFGILGSDSDRPTRESDCYALGMVIYEVLCGHAPYHDLSGNERVILAIMEGVRPKKPENATHLGFTKTLWDTVERCWLEDRRARPGVGDILSSLDGASPSWRMG